MAEKLTILPYDPSWPRDFEAERDRIATALGPVAVRIDHHGSTAVPGLAAKPIIDIQISVARLQPMEAYACALSHLGYEHLPHPADSFSPFFYRPHIFPHSHHVHVVQSGGSEERRTLAFRDYLREYDSIAREYETVKRALAPKFAATDFASRQAYADAKGDFINRITETALEQGYPRDL